ncbi:RICIN domain-containing protein [Plantactinospora sp. S1510]|uniref:RICIN domain-containing protein n=1 Tax=Plantactinospora alkalitolerans TaxID=2789879 RepID=A0ABS0GWR6_9ACTN|nr:RICIN domain-containing protein [Plantactinospora alkalitolerans]MBF9130631.1 RICIN domain-containing protein [Plantactinospora alkalitolerans]
MTLTITTRTPPDGRPRWRRWRGALVAATTAALVATGGVVGLSPASAATVDTSAYYVLVSRHSGKALDLYNLATGDGAPVVQWARNDGNQQQWQFVDAGSGYYKIRSRHSGKFLEMPNATDGTQLIQNADNGTTRQHFGVADSDGGYVRLLSRHSGKALDIWEWSTADGGIVAQYQDLGGYNQQWQMIRVGSGGGGDGSADCGSGSYNAEAVLSGSTWTARNGGSTVYTGSDMRSAMQAAVNSLSSGRTSKQRVVVRGSGSVSAGGRLSLPSYTILDVCGTMNVTGSGSGDQAPVYARGATDVEIQHLTLTGSPLYGIFMRNVNNLTLGQIDMRLSSGLGVRIDNHGGDRAVKVRNIRIDNVYVQGTSSQGVETYGVDGLTVGTVTARNVGESGLLLNDTINATIGTVDADNAGAGTGYAAFRMANRNGRVGSSYPTNIRVGTVVARGGGRGIFCVSESGGAVIDRVTISNTGNNSILIENCYNVTIAGQSGTVTGGGEVRIAARTEFPLSANITLQNLTVTNTNIRQSPCGGANNVIRNVTRVNSTLTWC